MAEPIISDLAHRTRISPSIKKSRYHRNDDRVAVMKGAKISEAGPCGERMDNHGILREVLDS